MKDEGDAETAGRGDAPIDDSAPASPRPRVPASLSSSPLRGQVSVLALARESARRVRQGLALRRERATLARGAHDARAPQLRAEFARLSPAQLVAHFRERESPRFFPGFECEARESSRLAREMFPRAFEELIERARRIVEEHRWSLLGCGEFDFGPEIDWLRDPLTGANWSRDFHADVKLSRGDGADVRVLWELNRLGHLVTLAQGYALTSDESLAARFFADIESWRAQNPVGRGANWASAMEVALRAMNLCAAFQIFRRSPLLDGQKLATLLATFAEHAAFVRRHLEFSHLATSNHYLSNVVGLLWLGVMLPELEGARAWREFGLRETLRELDKQVLPDGADYESSTGYHRLVAELFLDTFLLCRANDIEIAERYWAKLRAMLEYARAYLRPDASAPLVGDTDGGRVLALAPRAADEHAYLVAIGAVAFNEGRFKLSDDAPFELLWLTGAAGVRVYEALPKSEPPASTQFPHAGTYVLRDSDLYLLFNASGAGLKGRGSHAHNDALSVEVSVCGANFVVDPGTYVYTADLRARQLFRSTAYHSTVEVDGAEQNTTDERAPFRIGDEARPRLLSFSKGAELDEVAAEHYGYTRLTDPVTHARSVTLDRRRRLFLIEDSFAGRGAHTFRFRFHAGRGIDARVREGCAELYDGASGARLVVAPLNVETTPTVEARHTSRDYGERVPSQSLCWTVHAAAPLKVTWALVPICANDDEGTRLNLIEQLRESEGQLRHTDAPTPNP
ncbi:MAG: alginate lyase family protein [Pyrinomonadaceae bacterium]